MPDQIFECSLFESDINFCDVCNRVHIEQAFGKLVARWACLKNLLCFDLRKNIRVIEVCMKLHSYCLDSNDHDVTLHMTPENKDSRCQEARKWFQASRRLQTSRSAVQVASGTNSFTSTRRNALLEIVRRANEGRENTTGALRN